MALTKTPSELTAADITITTAAQPNITSLGTLTTLTIDDITINGSTISDGGDLTVDVAGEINLDADGGKIRFKDGGTEHLRFVLDNSGFVQLYSAVQDADIKIQGNDGGSVIDALTFDMSEAGNATFNGTITSNTLNSVSGNDLRLNAGSANRDVFFQVNGSTLATLQGSTGNYGIGSTSPQETLYLSKTATGNWIGINNETSSGNRYAGLNLRDQGTVKSQIYQNMNGGHLAIRNDHSTASTGIYTNGANLRMVIDADGRVIIGGSATIQDGYSTPGAHTAENNYYGKLWIQGNTYSTSGDGRLTLASGTAWPAANVALGQIFFSTSWGGDHASISGFSGGQVGNTDYPGELRFSTTADGASSPTERMRILSTGTVLVGKTTANAAAVGVELVPEGVLHVTKSSGNTYHMHDTANYKFYVNANGGIYNYSGNNVNLSDEREKKNIETLGSQWDVLKKWSLKKFHYNADRDNDPKKYGVIAQDVESHNPEVVTDFQSTDDETRKAVKEQQMMWMAIKALQEAMVRIESLEAKVKALEEA